MNSYLSKTVLISIFSHFAIFSFFTVSLGNRIPVTDYSTVLFWGQLLSHSEVLKPQSKAAIFNLHHPSKYYLDDKKHADNPIYKAKIPLGIKPAFSSVFKTEKLISKQKVPHSLISGRRKDPSLLFHPLLPYEFRLYFKDRQVAHVELLFKINSGSAKASTFIKRKISSGNLEVDLLTMRYIGHYLFIQQARFPKDEWRNVKIDLSERQD